MGGSTRRWARALAVAGAAVTIVIAGAAVASAKPPAPSSTSNASGGAYRPDTLVVGYARGTSATAKDAQQRRHGARREQRLGAVDVDVVHLPAGSDVTAAAQSYRNDPEVAFAEPDYVAHADAFSPNDPLFPQQYGPQKVQAVEAHNVLYPGGYTTPVSGNPTTVTHPLIAVVDTGIAGGASDPSANPDLVDKVLATAADCTLTSPSVTQPCPTSAPFDDYGHGTHVAGIAAAETNNASGMVGIAPNAELVSIKALDSTGSGYYSWIASGVLCAADLSRCGLGTGHADVINMSLGGSASSSLLQSAINTARAAGVVVVAAAGNNGTSQLSYPGAYADLSVIATDQNDAKPSWSQYGGYANMVSAPGSSILSTVSTNPSIGISSPTGFAYLSGTSMATPHVAGVAALLVGVVPTATDIVNRIKLTADPLPSAAAPNKTLYGAGRVNALAAVTYVAPPPPPDFSLSGSPASQTVSRRNVTTFTVTITRLNNDTKTINLIASGLPRNASASFTPSSVTGTSSQLRISTTQRTTTGTFTITIIGKDGTLTRTTTVRLTVVN